MAGQRVRPGDILLTIEAMKMETAVYAPITGIVRDLLVAAGSSVEAHDLLLVIAAPDGQAGGS